jgi:hypothetical protein
MAIKSPRNTVIAILLLATVAYCALPKSASWKEEVLLSDGRLVVLERSLTFGGRAEIGRLGAPVEKWTLRIPLNDGQMSERLETPGGLEQVMVDIDKGVIYVAAAASRGDAYYGLGCPNPPFIFFKHINGWKRIPPSEFPPRFVTPNLPVDTEAYEKLANEGHRIGIEQIKALNGQRSIDPGALKIQTIPFPGAARDSLCGDGGNDPNWAKRHFPQWKY